MALWLLIAAQSSVFMSGGAGHTTDTHSVWCAYGVHAVDTGLHNCCDNGLISVLSRLITLVHVVHVHTRTCTCTFPCKFTLEDLNLSLYLHKAYGNLYG